jgi:ribosomal protein S18 acetylase RimI-like enzyme
MDVLLERIQLDSHHCMVELSSLYLVAFPKEERRELDVLLDMLNEKKMYFSAVFAGEQLVGLVVYWKFEEFLYIEHLALFQEQRRKGIGGQVLKLLQKEGFPLLLEVEIPYDEASIQRVSFYNRSGFSALTINYFQPPYREGESLLPMKLFSDKTDWDQDILSKHIQLFQSEVYFNSSKAKS